MEKEIQIRKPLTWAELKEKIEQMPKEQLNENVKIWSENIPLESECYLESESELDDYKKEECILVLEKGNYFLSF